MKSSEAVRNIMKEQGVSLTMLADRLDKPVRLVSDRLRMENISVEKLKELLRGLDYRVVIMPTNERIPNGAVEIE